MVRFFGVSSYSYSLSLHDRTTDYWLYIIMILHLCTSQWYTQCDLEGHRPTPLNSAPSTSAFSTWLKHHGPSPICPLQACSQSSFSPFVFFQTSWAGFCTATWKCTPRWYLKTQRVQQTTPPSRDCGALALQKQELRSLYLADTRCQVSVLRSNLASFVTQNSRVGSQNTNLAHCFLYPNFWNSSSSDIVEEEIEECFPSEGWKLYMCVCT